MKETMIRLLVFAATQTVLAAIAFAQDSDIYIIPRVEAFQQSYGNGSDKLVIAKAIADAQPIELQDSEGKTVSVRRQKVEVYNLPAGIPTVLNIVSGGYNNKLPIGRRVLLLYLEPREGSVELNTRSTVTLEAGDVAARLAVPTSALRPADGGNFQERFFSSLLEAIPSLDFHSMVEVTRMLPMPPGYDFQNLRGARKFNEYLKRQCEVVGARGDLFATAFLAQVSSWAFDEATPFLLEALLRNLSDARVEDILVQRYLYVSSSGLKGSEYSHLKPEGQARLLAAAQTAASDSAAALFARLIHNPLYAEKKVAFVSLLKRPMPLLRREVCDTLAVLTDKRERTLSGPGPEETQEAWVARVTAMAQLWLREFGLDG